MRKLNHYSPILSAGLIALKRRSMRMSIPPESAIKPELIRQLKKANADIKKGKGKTYNSIDDFFKEIET